MPTFKYEDKDYAFKIEEKKIDLYEVKLIKQAVITPELAKAIVDTIGELKTPQEAEQQTPS